MAPSTKNFPCAYRRPSKGRPCPNRVAAAGGYCPRHVARVLDGPAPVGDQQAQILKDVSSLLKQVGSADAADLRDPRQVLLEQVTRSHQMVAVLDAMVRELTEADMRLLGYEDEAFSLGVLTRRALKARHVRAVLELHGKWVAEASRISKMTMSAGVEERLVRLAEQQSRLIADVIRGALEALPLSPELRQQAMHEVAYRLRALEAPAPLQVGSGYGGEE